MKLNSYIFLLFLLIGSTNGFTQETIWADKVLEVSSEMDHSAVQILGMPDALTLSDQDLSWTPRKEGAIRNEFIQVEFKRPIRTRQVIVAEASHPGSISAITLYFEDGATQLIYENKYPRAILSSTRLFNYSFPLTRQRVVSLKLELNTRGVRGFNRIDAIGISDQIDPIVLESSEEVELSGNMGTEINSPSAEVLPRVSPDGQVLYFVRKDHANNMGAADIWVSYRESEDRWSSAVNVGAPLNNRQPNQVLGVSADNRKIYLKSGISPKSNNNIFVTQRSGRSWARPRKLNTKFSLTETIKDFYIGKDGETILVAIQTPDHGFDIQVTEKQGNGWSELQSLGIVINTHNDETSMSLSADEKTLYFSSNGHGGAGGQDMFMSRRLGNSWTNWSPPINLGKEINTTEDDERVSFTEDGEVAFFSNKNKNGNPDIFQYSFFEPLTVLGLKSSQNEVENSSKKAELSNTQVKSISSDLLVTPETSNESPEMNLELELQKMNQQLADLEYKKQQAARQKIDARQIPEKFLKGKEMETLRNQYIQQQKQRGIISTNKKTRGANSAKDKNIGNKKSDAELDDMKRRFNQYNGKKADPTENEQYMEMEVGNGEVYDDARDQSTYSEGFVDLQRKMWTVLESELTPLIRLTVKKQIYNQVETQLIRSLSTLDEEAKYRLKQQGILYYREIKKELRKVGEDKVPLRGIPENEVTIALRRKMEPAVRKNLYAGLRALAADEIRNELHYRFVKGEKVVAEKSLRDRPSVPKVMPAPAPVEGQSPSPPLLTNVLLEKTPSKIPLQTGQAFLLANIFFDESTADLKSNSSSAINQAVVFLNQNKRLSVEVGVYEDGSGAEMAFARAQAIYDTLIRKGIPAYRLLFRDYNSVQTFDQLGQIKAQLKIVAIR